MKKFILSLLGLALLSVTGIIATYAVMIYRYQPKLTSIYSIAPNQDVLFIGSSQIGCGARRLPKYHHKLIWYMTSTFPTFEIHLRELERRGQLDGVKLLIMNLNNRSLVQLEEENVQRIWHRALPLYWRYWKDYPASRMSFLWYAMNHFQDVTSFACSDGEEDHYPVTEKDEKEFRTFLAEAAKDARERGVEKRLSGYEQMMCDSLVHIKDIADRHGIRAITVAMPVLKEEMDNLNPFEVKRLESLIAFSSRLGISHYDLGVFEDGCFFDEVHLTTAGSELFMKRLYTKLGLQINE